MTRVQFEIEMVHRTAVAAARTADDGETSERAHAHSNERDMLH